MGKSTGNHKKIRTKYGLEGRSGVSTAQRTRSCYEFYVRGTKKPDTKIFEPVSRETKEEI